MIVLSVFGQRGPVTQLFPSQFSQIQNKSLLDQVPGPRSIMYSQGRLESHGR